MVSAYSIGKAKRSNSLIYLSTPGPGSYQVNSSPKKNFQNNYRKSSQNKSIKKDLWVEDAVGPGSYNINKFAKTSKYKGTPQFSFPKSKFPERKGFKGEDTIYYPRKEDISHKYSFGKQPKIVHPQNPNPGPGSYTVKPPKSGKVAIFGTSDREDIVSKENTPGPGTYKIKIFKTTKENKFPASLRPFQLLPPTPSPYPLPSTLSHQAFSFPKTTHDSNQRTEERPGPSHYAMKFEKLFKKSAGFIFDREEKAEKVKPFGPGPGAYEMKEVKRFKSYKVAKPIKKTNLTDPNIDSPGPGQYKLKEKWNDGPKFIFGERLNKIGGRGDSPGPAEYKIKERMDNPSYTIGKSLKFRDENRTKIIPGPGQYYPKNKPTHPFIIFDKAKPLFHEKNNPGPGTYSLKPTFADVPNYLFYNIKKKIEL